jgi:hypothetical protein
MSEEMQSSLLVGRRKEIAALVALVPLQKSVSALRAAIWRGSVGRARSCSVSIRLLYLLIAQVFGWLPLLGPTLNGE